jgi:hypothetical protein
VVADIGNPDITYAAVGRATSAWETLEAHLSYLYSIFVEKPMLVDAMEEYGRDRTTITARTKALNDAATAYFVKFPNQNHEAILGCIIKETEELASKRHQIAHGVVNRLPAFTGSKNELGYYADSWGYLLMPPWHALYNLARKKGDDHYRWGSQDIDAWTAKFYACAERVNKLAEAINPPKA